MIVILATAPAAVSSARDTDHTAALLPPPLYVLYRQVVAWYVE